MSNINIAFKNLLFYPTLICTFATISISLQKLSPNHFNMNNAIAGFSKLSKEEKIN
jgi:hypothetical protein